MIKFKTDFFWWALPFDIGLHKDWFNPCFVFRFLCFSILIYI